MHNIHGRRGTGVPGYETLGGGFLLVMHDACARLSQTGLPHWHDFIIPWAGLRQMQHLMDFNGALPIICLLVLAGSLLDLGIFSFPSVTIGMFLVFGDVERSGGIAKTALPLFVAFETILLFITGEVKSSFDIGLLEAVPVGSDDAV